MILEISLNETKRSVEGISESINFVAGLLNDLEMIQPGEIAASLVVKMFTGCDTIMLCIGDDKLLIKRIRTRG